MSWDDTATGSQKAILIARLANDTQLFLHSLDAAKLLLQCAVSDKGDAHKNTQNGRKNPLTHAKDGMHAEATTKKNMARARDVMRKKFYISFFVFCPQGLTIPISASSQ